MLLQKQLFKKNLYSFSKFQGLLSTGSYPKYYLHIYSTPEECYNYQQTNSQDTKFLDFRTQNEYYSCHIPNAIPFCNHIDILKNFRKSYERNHQLTEIAQQMEEKLQNSGINNNDTLILYDNPMKMNFNTQIFYFLVKYMGHDKISILNGGIDAWEYSDFETTSQSKSSKEVYNFKRGDFKMNIQDQNIIQSGELRKIIQQKYFSESSGEDEENGIHENIKIIDARYEKEYNKGHIPYSINIPVQKIMNVTQLEGVQYKDKNDIKKILHDNNIQENDNIIVYCNKGTRATVFYSELQNAGFKKVKNYIGSFYEWQIYLYQEYQRKKNMFKIHFN